MDRGYKRRKYFIQKDFQGKFILQLLAVSFAGSILAVLLFIFMANRKMDNLLCRMSIPASVFRGNVLIHEALWANGIAVAVIAVIFIFAGFAVFRKIAGPLSSIRNEVMSISGLNLASKAVLRKEDDFHDIADEVNHLSAELNRRFSSINDRTSRISEITNELRQAYNPDDGQYSKRITALLEEINALRQEIGAFKK